MARIMLVHQPVDGGVARYVADLYHGFTAAGHEVITCGPRAADGVPEGATHLTLGLTRAVDPRVDGACVRSLRSMLRTVRPDLVHAHSSKAGAITRLANGVSGRVPMVYSPHLFAFAGHFNRGAERAAYRAVEQILAGVTDCFLCVCEAEAELARGLGFPGRVRVVHYGVPAAGDGVPEARMSQLRAAGPVVCGLAVLSPRKGIDTLVDAAPAIRRAVPEAQFAIWGYGPELDSLRARAQAGGAGQAIHFLGPATDALGVLRGADTFVVPSWAEAFPYVILEAMSVACPIVATDVGGIAEALDDGGCGLLMAPGESSQLARAAIELLTDPAGARSMGDRARRRVSELYSTERMLRGVSAVYEELWD
jgi:glycosyltransferase involved in cell wall biosynthesis